MTIAEAQTYAPDPLPENVEIIDVDKIRPSKTNPRKHDKKPSPDFVESVRVQGVMQPIIVVVAEGGRGFYDIVFGEMRWTASKLAGRTTIRAIVRHLEPDEIFEAQIIENSQRKDVHPLDESDAFAELVKRGYEQQRIADRIGRPVTYVAQRLKLRELGKEAREALDEERISLAVALQIARVPEKLQKEALEEVAPIGMGRRAEDLREVMTSKGAAAAIRERFMLRLVDARFDTTDVTLVPKAGACAICPKRTGNQGELFADVDSPDLCTDPTCFRAKTDAHWKIASAAAKKSGQQVLSEKEAKKLFPYDFDDKPRGSAFHDLNGEVYNPSGRNVKVKALLGKDAPAPALVRNPHTGKIFELVPKAVVDKALKAREKAKGGGASSGESAPRKQLTTAEKAKLEREKLKAKAGEAVTQRVAQRAAEALEQLDDAAADALLLPVLLRHVCENLYDEPEERVLLRRGFHPKGKRITPADFDQFAVEGGKQAVHWQRGTLLELLLVSGDSEHTLGKTLVGLVKELDIDRKAIETEVIAELKAGKDPLKPTTEGVCRECGCTDEAGCEEYDAEDQVTICHWVEPDLCSACVDKAEQPAKGKAKRKAAK